MHGAELGSSVYFQSGVVDSGMADEASVGSTGSSGVGGGWWGLGW